MGIPIVARTRPRLCFEGIGVAQVGVLSIKWMKLEEKQVLYPEGSMEDWDKWFSLVRESDSICSATSGIW